MCRAEKSTAEQEKVNSERSSYRQYKLVIEGGDVDAQHDLAYAYWHGENGAKTDHEKALGLYHRAAQGGHAHAQWELGCAYKDGMPGLEVDEEKALWMLREAADGGGAEAQYELSEAYLMGNFGLEVDQEKAYGFVQEAAKGGSSRAQGTVKRIETTGTYCDCCMCPEFLCAGHGSEFCEEFVRVITYMEYND